MKVTNLKLTKRGNRVNLYIDGKYIISLGRNLIVDLGIYKGQEVTAKDVKDWERADVCEKQYSKILNLIARRPRSKKEIYLYLRRKLFKVKGKDNIIQKVTLKLERQGYLDDHKFALWWVNNRMMYKPRGKFMIVQELRQKGINHDIISEAIEDVGLDYRKEIQYALELGRKKRRTSGDLMNERNKKKFFNYLIRKGFGYSVAKKVYEKLKQD